jgi:hypothetical protein
MPYAFEGNMDLLNKLRRFGLPQQSNPMSGLNPMPFEGGMPPQQPMGMPFQPMQLGGGFGPQKGGSGPMGFPNPLASLRPFVYGASPMGRVRKGAGMIRPY